MNLSTTSPEPSTSKQGVRSKRPQSASLPTLAKEDDSKLSREVYESILWRIDSKCPSNETVAIGLTGCAKKSGSTTVAANLAIHASEQQRGRVLLIDANWQLPGLLKTFGLSQNPGLYDILSGEISPRECEPQAVSEFLDVLSRGKWDDEQPSHVRNDLVEEMLSDFKTEYSLILVDLPPAENMRGALQLARQLDGSLLIARFEAAKQPQAQQALGRLHEDGVDVWGSILNRHREYVPQWLRNWL